MRRIALLTFIILTAVCAFGQAVRVDLPIQTYGPTVPTSQGPLPQALWVANGSAYICTHPSATLAACQASPVTTYTDATEGTSCPAATPLVQLPGNTCTASTGAAANLGFWYAGGPVDYYLGTSYGTFGPYTYTPSGPIASIPVTVAQGGTGSTTAAGANLNITGVTQTGTLGTSSQVSTFPGTVTAKAMVLTSVPQINPTASAYASTAATAMRPVPMRQSLDPLMSILQAQLAAASVTRVRGVVIGDSTWCCTGPTSQANGQAQQFRNWLQTNWGNGGWGLIPIGDTTGTGTRPEWTMSGTWGTVTDLGPTQTGSGAFGSVFYASGTSNTLTLTSQYGNTVEVYGETTTDSAGCSVFVDGSVVGMVGTTTSGSPSAFRSTFAVTLGNHVVKLAPSGAGKCYAYGVGFTVGTAGVVFDNVAHGYAASTAWGVAPSTQLAFVAAEVPTPSFAIVALGINDDLGYGAASQSAYAANMQALITGLLAINPSMSIIIEDENDVAPQGDVNQTLIRASEIALAQSNNLSYTSIHDSWVSESNANTLGLMNADGVHPNDAGGIAIGYQTASYISGQETGVTANTGSSIFDPSGNAVVPGQAGFLSNCEYNGGWYYISSGSGCIGFYSYGGVGGGKMVVAPLNTGAAGAAATPITALTFDGVGNATITGAINTSSGNITSAGNFTGPGNAGYFSNLYYQSGWKYVSASQGGIGLLTSNGAAGGVINVAPLNTGAAGAAATPITALTFDGTGNASFAGQITGVSNITSAGNTAFLSGLYYSGGWKYASANTGGMGFSTSGGTGGGKIIVAPNNAGAAGAAATPVTALTFDGSGNTTASGTVKAAGYQSSDGTAGYTGTCASTATLTVKNGLIVGCS